MKEDFVEFHFPNGTYSTWYKGDFADDADMFFKAFNEAACFEQTFEEYKKTIIQLLAEEGCRKSEIDTVERLFFFGDKRIIGKTILEHYSDGTPNSGITSYLAEWINANIKDDE